MQGGCVSTLGKPPHSIVAEGFVVPRHVVSGNADAVVAFCAYSLLTGAAPFISISIHARVHINSERFW